jgi:large subunit ribosomal protein L4
MVAMLTALDAGKKPLVVLPGVDEMVVKSCANIPGAKTAVYNTINVYDILNSGKMIIDRSAVEKIEEVYAE